MYKRQVRLNAELIPSQAPGSTQGAVYTWLDVEVEAGQTTFYWLEDMDLSGATTLHGPVSATYLGPTAVALISFAASQPKPAQTPGASAAAMPLALLVAGLVAAMGLWRWRAGRRI